MTSLTRFFGSGFKNAIAVIRSKYSRSISNTYSEDCVRIISYRADFITIARLKKNWQQFAAGIGAYPGGFEGKGIVMCAGGIKYFTCAWVNINMLRKLGCSLPIELWYNGKELTPEIIGQLKELNVTCKNSEDYGGAEMENYALKPFAIIKSSFKEVMFLDADNNCVKEPAYLFESSAYKKLGTIFWPDFWKTEKENSIWKIIGSQDYDSMEQESGQILINKEQCWKELNLCLYFNTQRKSYYKMLLGDKDTFKFAWMALGTPYHMIPTPVAHCGYRNQENGHFLGLCMVQHDEQGRVLFLHRNMIKWDITKNNELVWQQIVRYKDNAKSKKVTLSGINGMYFQAITGDVEYLDFNQLFGNYEEQCLEILRNLRTSYFYMEFLQENYFSYFRPYYPAKISNAVTNETN